MQRKAEDFAEVTHLALLGVKIIGNGILGFTKENSVLLLQYAYFFEIYDTAK
jgi:hypothetical protein